MIVGLFLDGWAHDNNKPESFFTPWHGVLYSGFGAATLAAVLVAARSRQPGITWQETLPRGHGLTLAALASFAVGAAGDLAWHEILGVEVGVEALLSPTHLLLLAGGLIALSAPLRAAWVDDATAPPSLRTFLPVVLTVALLVALVGFFMLYLSPFINDAAGQRFDRVPGVRHDHPSNDVGELRQLLGVSSVLMTTVLITSGVYVLLRRWKPPIGSFAVLIGVVLLLFTGANEFQQPSLLLVGIAAGAAADALAPRAPPWLVGSGATLSLWLGYFGAYELFEGGVAWSAELWLGTTTLAVLIAAVLGLIVAEGSARPDRLGVDR